MTNCAQNYDYLELLKFVERVLCEKQPSKTACAYFFASIKHAFKTEVTCPSVKLTCPTTRLPARAGKIGPK